MDWTISWAQAAIKELKKLDKDNQRLIIKYLKERILSSTDPRQFGKALSHDKAGLWRYRIGNFMIICNIEDHKFIILILRVAHRRHSYD